MSILLKRWSSQRLGDCCDLVKIKHSGEPLSYVGLENIESGTGRLQIEPEKMTAKSATFYFDSEKLLYGRLRPYLNKIYLPSFEGHCSSEIFPIQCANNLDKKYLFYWLFQDSVVEKINQTSTGARMPRANMMEVLNFQIPLPSISEQKQIVHILDDAFSKIDKVIENTEKNIENCRELFESYLNNVFEQKGDDWEEKTLEEITLEITDGDHSPPPKSESGVPFITISNIDKNKHVVNFEETFFVSDEYYNKLKDKRKPKVGDVLYTVTGSYGIPVCVESTKEFCFQRHIALLRPSHKVTSLWLYYSLLSSAVKKQVNSGVTGTAQKTIGLKVLRAIQVSVPTLEKQEEILGNIIDVQNKNDVLIGQYVRKLDCLQELKQSILQKAFTGELTKGFIN